MTISAVFAWWSQKFSELQSHADTLIVLLVSSEYTKNMIMSKLIAPIAALKLSPSSKPSHKPSLLIKSKKFARKSEITTVNLETIGQSNAQ